MSEDKADYLAGNGHIKEAIAMLGAGYDKAAVIERPRKAHAIGESGLEEYQLYGWVKMSAKFCAHIKKLRGAKLAIWLCLALNIDEDGECNLTQKELCAMTGYSHTEVIESVTELDEMGFLSVDRSGKKNLYSPVFVAKGKGNSPSKETLVKKLDSTPADSDESSPAYKNSVPTSIKKKKEYPLSPSKPALQGIEASIYSGRPTTQEDIDFSKAQADSGVEWRGREFLAPEHLPYGDWWHAKTGLHMYGAKGKAKLDSGWLKAFKELFENEVTLQSCDAAMESNKWRNISTPAQIVNDAKAIQASQVVNTSAPVQIDETGIPETY